ncbi:MAG: Hsp20/alpha crystallin family protein [Lachnospiraceae bacterium]|nr:Hsp20/alpha crystallin family protein [Lachnospiraceae bacterium]
MLTPSIFTNSSLENIFDDFFNGAYYPVRKGAATISAMNTDIKETEDGFELEMDLPGFKKEDINAELEKGYLTIKASHQESKDEQDQKGNYIRRERYSGSYQRSFYVGDDMKQEDIKAGFKDGVLKISIPKVGTKEIPQKSQISIEG